MIIEKIETINARLDSLFGRYLDNRPNWRLVFSHDELEKRHGTFEDRTSEGFLIRSVTEVREVPKYRQWINPPCYVLERLLEVPDGVNSDLTEKTSYEPVWTFRDANNNPLIPAWNAIKIIIDTVYSASAKSVGRKYVDPREDLVDPKIALEVRNEKLKELEEELFGNESKITDGLAYHGGIVVPSNYEKMVLPVNHKNEVN